jgi:hypothetical protein
MTIYYILIRMKCWKRVQMDRHMLWDQIIRRNLRKNNAIRKVVSNCKVDPIDQNC